MITVKPMDYTPVGYEKIVDGVVTSRGQVSRTVFEMMVLRGDNIREISLSDVNDIGLGSVTTEVTNEG